MANPFTYLARDLLTWNELDTLPYKGVQFGKVLDQPGAWKGDLPLASKAVQEFDWKDATRPSRTALFVDLEGTLVWGGVIWLPNYESDDPTHSLKVQAQDFHSILGKRLQAQDYKETWASGEDPMKVVKRIIEDAQAAELTAAGHLTGTKIPLVLNPSAGSGQSIPFSYPATSLQTLESIIGTLSQMGYGAGFDISFDVAYEPGTNTPAVTINLWYPLKGRTAEESEIVILAKECVKWTYPEDGTTQGWEITETGGTSVASQVATADVPGYPLWQKVVPRSQVTTTALLDECAIGDLALYGYPSVTPSFILPVGLPGSDVQSRSGLRLGEFDVGDRFSFKIDEMDGTNENVSPRFPEGMQSEWRCNQWTCTPSDSGLSLLQIDAGIPPLGYVPAPAPPH